MIDTVVEAPTLHALLTLALEDFKLAEQDPKCTIDMNTWYERYGNACYLCMAGAMLYRRLPIGDVPDTVRYRMSAVDYLRIGHIGEAVYVFYGTDKYIDRLVVPPYNENPEAFHAGIQEVLTYLKENDL